MLGGEVVPVHLVGEQSWNRLVPVEIKSLSVNAADRGVLDLMNVHCQLEGNGSAEEGAVLAGLVRLKMTVQAVEGTISQYSPVQQDVAKESSAPAKLDGQLPNRRPSSDGDSPSGIGQSCPLPAKTFHLLLLVHLEPAVSSTHQ